MNIQIVGPIGLTVLFGSGCGDGGLQDHNAIVPSATVSIYIEPSAPIDNVQQLDVQFLPALMYVDCSTGDCPYYALISDDDSADRSYASTEDICRSVYVTTPPSDLTEAERANWQPHSEQRCDTPEKRIRIVDMLTTHPLWPAPLVTNARIPEAFLRRVSHIQMQTRSNVNVRDSYVHLYDGRECEINVVFPNGAEFMLTNFAISNRDKLRITMTIDISGTIDPTRCAAPQDLFVNPVRADIQRLSGFTWSNKPVRLAGYTWSNKPARLVGYTWSDFNAHGVQHHV
jgi:hypothetical protein